MNIIKYRYYSQFGIVVDDIVVDYTEKESLQNLIHEVALLFAYNKQVKNVKIFDCILKQWIFDYSREK